MSGRRFRWRNIHYCEGKNTHEGLAAADKSILVRAKPGGGDAGCRAESPPHVDRRDRPASRRRRWGVYQHFRSKRQLLLVLMDDLLERLACARTSRPTPPVAAKIVGFFSRSMFMSVYELIVSCYERS